MRTLNENVLILKRKFSRFEQDIASEFISKLWQLNASVPTKLPCLLNTVF